MPPCPTEDSCLLFLVRHGATANNLADPPLLQGSSVDMELSAEGRWQAEQTALLLAGRPLQGVFSSPLLRAQQTAEAIAAPHGLSVGHVLDLQEVDVGAWEGRSWRDISKSEPDRHQQFLADAGTHGYPDGENMTQVLQRAGPAIEKLMRDHLGQQIVAVAHNVVNRVYLASLLDIPPSRARTIKQDNCCVNVLWYRQAKVKLLTLNSAFHAEG